MTDRRNIWRNNTFTENFWLFIDDDAPLPENGDVVVSARRFGAECPKLLQRPFGGLGVRFGPDDPTDVIADCVARIDLVVLDVPTFADGRAYSKARIIRDKYIYRGELRAAGDVLIDQIPFMRRCGFDSFEIIREPTRAALAAGAVPAVDRFYQPIGDGEATVPGRSWLRRAAAE